jgi:hypothetical protein
MPKPDGCDKVHGWELAEKFEPSDEPALQWIPPMEPQIQLDEDGLPPDHSCPHCQRLVIQEAKLKDSHTIPIANSRDELTCAAKNGCPLYQYLEWYIYGESTNASSPFSHITLRFSSADNNPKLLGRIRGGFRDWAPNSRGEKAKEGFGYFSFVARWGTISLQTRT